MSRTARRAAFVIHIPLCNSIGVTQTAQLPQGKARPFLPYLRNEMIT
jgi:hypothetical protein